jgi:DNA polymerase III subunit delta
MHTYDQIMSDLKKKIYHPVYFLMGDETYYIDAITEYMDKNILPEAEKSFNQSVLYGKDLDLGKLLNAARRFPMMSNYSLIIVKEAQDLKGIDGGGADKVDPFLLYIEKPLKSTILVINYKGKSLDKRRKIYKAIEQHGVLFESKKIYEDKVGKWIIDYLKAEGREIDPRAAELMAGQLGNDLSKVVNEINKLLILTPQSVRITSKEIEDNVGISKEFNVFELQNSIGRKDLAKTALIVHHISKNPKNSIIPTIGMLFAFFTKLMMIHGSKSKEDRDLAPLIGVSPFFMKDYHAAAKNYSAGQCAAVIGILREYDAYSKGIDSPAVDDMELLLEMVYKIILA